MKERIVERLLALQKLNWDDSYVLEQSEIVDMFHHSWGKSAVVTTPTANDRLHVFGIIMTQTECRPLLQCICDGAVDRPVLDNPELSLQHMFSELALSFNNQEVEVSIPKDAYNLQYIHLLDANDMDRITIQRDCKYSLS